MNNELLLFPHTLVNRTLLKGDLDRYIRSDSLQQLILALRKYHREGLLNFEVRLNPVYVEQQDALSTLKTRTDVLKPNFPMWAYRSNSDGLARFYADIEAKKPLSEAQSAEIIEKLPADIALQYFQFKITHVEWERLKEYVSKQPRSSVTRSKNSFNVSKYKDLQVDGIHVTYKGRSVHLTNQHTEVVRLLIDHGGAVCTYDEFLENYASIFTKHDLADPQDTLIKLISAVRTKLKPIIGYNCIINIPSVGWCLQLN